MACCQLPTVNCSRSMLAEVGIPTEAGLPHAFGNAFRNVAALIADIDFTFKEADVDVNRYDCCSCRFYPRTSMILRWEICRVYIVSGKNAERL